MAVFSKNDAVDDAIVSSAESSAVMTRKNITPSPSPPRNVRRFICCKCLGKRSARNTNAIKNRRPSRVNFPIPCKPIFESTKDVLRARMTAASRISAFLRVNVPDFMVFPPVFALDWSILLVYL